MRLASAWKASGRAASSLRSIGTLLAENASDTSSRLSSRRIVPFSSVVMPFCVERIFTRSTRPGVATARPVMPLSRYGKPVYSTDISRADSARR